MSMKRFAAGRDLRVCGDWDKLNRLTAPFYLNLILMTTTIDIIHQPLSSMTVA